MAYFTWGTGRHWHIERMFDVVFPIQDDDSHSFCRNVCNETTPGYKRRDQLPEDGQVCKRCIRSQEIEMAEKVTG